MDLYISAPETLVVISLEHAEEVNLLRLRDSLCTRLSSVICSLWIYKQTSAE